MRNLRWFVLGALLVAVALAAFVGPFASKAPDGLDRIAIDKGFASKEAGTLRSPLADYQVPVAHDRRISTGLAGVIGTLLVFGAGLGLAKLVSRRREAA
jgi:cobalt/nickel transport protein